jgi:hypothetical protein
MEIMQGFLLNRVRRGEAAQRAGRVRADDRAVVSSARRTNRQAAIRVHFDVGRKIIGKINGVAGGLVLFQRELAFRCIDLAQIVDTGISLRSLAGLDEVWNRNRRQQTDDGDDNHDFHEGETSLTDLGVFFHTFLFFIFIRPQPNRARLIGGINLNAAPTATGIIRHY